MRNPHPLTEVVDDCDNITTTTNTWPSSSPSSPSTSTAPFAETRASQAYCRARLQHLETRRCFTLHMHLRTGTGFAVGTSAGSLRAQAVEFEILLQRLGHPPTVDECVLKSKLPPAGDLFLTLRRQSHLLKWAVGERRRHFEQWTLRSREVGSGSGSGSGSGGDGSGSGSGSSGSGNGSGSRARPLDGLEYVDCKA